MRYKKYGLVNSAESPKKLVIGPATQAAKDPLIANTMKMAITCQLELIPHRFFNFSISSRLFGKCKYNI